jgi:carbamoyl-phosphate synthase small subunit
MADSSHQTGVLALEDGSVFRGPAFGARKTVLGEAVFNTSMTGYQEILTDPSYFGQIVTMTAPQIGNYGINPFDAESDSPKAAGFVIRELSPVTSSWRSRQNLDDYLKASGIPGVEGVDTRAITKKLRVTGVLKSCLSTEGISDAEAIRRAREWPGLIGVDYVKEVTCKAPYVFKSLDDEERPFTVRGTKLHPTHLDRKRYKVAAFDYGAKRSILRKLVYHGFEVTVVPATATAADVDKLNPDAIFLSNGPGDPAALTYAHNTVNDLMPRYPIFGICLGHQIITHALGAHTFKLKFGHRGGNQPVKNLETGKVSITAQNHGFASRPEEIAKVGAIVTEVNLNDQTVEGLRHQKLPVFSVQYHPEAAPGPNDADPLFEDFYKMVQLQRG